MYQEQHHISARIFLPAAVLLITSWADVLRLCVPNLLSCDSSCLSCVHGLGFH
jgi:hypothetical protein